MNSCKSKASKGIKTRKLKWRKFLLNPLNFRNEFSPVSSFCVCTHVYACMSVCLGVDGKDCTKTIMLIRFLGFFFTYIVDIVVLF